MRILKENALVVLIDAQEKLMPLMSRKEDTFESMKLLLSGLNYLSVPLIITEQYPKGLGETIDFNLPHLVSSLKVEKRSFSACGEPDFINHLKDFNKSTIILIGIESHICVLQTVIDLVKMGFNVVVVEDAVSSRKDSDKQIALKRMVSEGALLTTVESLLFELCKTSLNPEFKSISKLIK